MKKYHSLLCLLTAVVLGMYDTRHVLTAAAAAVISFPSLLVKFINYMQETRSGDGRGQKRARE